MSKLRRPPWRAACAPIRAAGIGAASLLILAGASLAQDRGFYAGYTATAELFDATFSKSVDNTAPDTLVPEPRRGMVFHDRDSSDTVDLAAGFVGGYLAPLGDGGAYLSTEVDVMFHSGEYNRRISLRFEAAYSEYGDESWIADFPDVGVTVPSTVEAEGIGVTVSLVRLFGRAD